MHNENDYASSSPREQYNLDSREYSDSADAHNAKYSGVTFCDALVIAAGAVAIGTICAVARSPSLVDRILN